MKSLPARLWKNLRGSSTAQLGERTAARARVLDCLQYEPRTLFSATPLAAEVLVNADTTGAQQTTVETQQAVAADSSGNFVVVWTSDGQDGDGTGVFAQRFDASGNKVGSEIQVNTETTGAQQNASVAMDADGDFVVVWEILNGSTDGYAIRGQRFDSSGGAVGGEFTVNTATVDHQRDPSVATDASGNFVVTWSSLNQDGDGYGIYGQLYDSAGAAVGSEFQVHTSTSGDQLYSSVAYDGAGGFIVTWTGVDADGSGIFAQRFNSSGVAQGSEISVNSTTTDDQLHSTVGADAVGNFVIAWASNLQDGSGYGIYARRFDSSGVAQGSEFRVNVTTSGDQSAPRVAMASDGSFVVTWTSNGQDVAGSDGVYFRQYDASGTALSNETLVNTTTSGNQRYSSVAMQSTDSFAVVWSGNGPGDADGVFAQLYVDGNNQDPVNTVPGAQSTAEDTPLVFSSGNGNQISVADADAQANPLQVTLVGTNGTLTLASVAGLTFSAGDGADDASLTFAGTAADVNAALNGLTFTPGTNFTGAAGVAITTNDLGYSGSGGAKSDTDNIAVTVTAVNDAPVNAIPGVQSTLPNTAVVFSAGNGNQISISDVDAGGSTVRVTLAATSGTMTLSGTSGLSFTSGDGTADAAMTFTGTIASINNALNGLTFTPMTSYNGTATVTLTTNDLGNTGSGGAQSTASVISINVGATTALWFSTQDDVSGSGIPNLPNWKDGSVIQLSDPNLAFEPGTSSGTFSLVVNFDLLGDGNVDIDAMQYVSRTVVIGSGANTITLQEGDLLLSTKDPETFSSVNSLSVNRDEVFLFRPNSPGNYSSGTFTMVLDNFTSIHGGGDTWAIAVVEADTVVGDVTLTAGSFLYSRSGGAEDNDIYLFTPTGVGNGTTAGTVSKLIEGDQLGISPKVWGLDLIETDTVIGDVTLTAGQILVTIDADDSSVGSTSTNIKKEDTFILTVAQTTLGSGTASATATILVQGTDVGLDGVGKNIDALTLVASNQPPAIGLPSGALAYTENDPATVLDSSATLTDAYSSNYDTGTLTVSFTAGGTAGDRLDIRNQGTGAGQIGISGSNVTYEGAVIGTFSGGTDGSTPLVVTFDADATPAAAQALLRNITYRNVSDAPATAVRTVQFVLNDGDGHDSNAATKTVNLTAVNDGPANTVPGAQTTAEDTTLVFSGGNGNQISIADVDAGTNSMQVTLTATNGTVTLSGITGLTFSSGDGTTDATMTFTGTVSAINTALNGLGFTPTGNFNGAAQLQIVTSDQGNTGTGGALADTDNVAINVTAVNDAPVNTVPGAQSVAEDGTLVFSSGNGNQISIADVDASTNSVQVTLTATNGTVTLGGVAGLTFSSGDGTADATMTFTGTVTAIDTALNGLGFTPSSDFTGAAQLQIITNDQGNTGAGGALSDVDNIAVTVTAVNDAPTAVVTPASYTVDEQTTLTLHGTGLSIADVDAGSNNVQATVSVVSGTLTAAAGTTGVTVGGSGTNTVTLIGTLTQINDLLAGNLSGTLTYTINSDTPPATDALTLQVSDLGNTGSGGTLTGNDTATINVTAVNDAPINSVPAAQSTTEDTPLVFSTGNGNRISIADVDASTNSVQVTLTATNGTITLPGTAGLSFTGGDGTADASMTFTGTAAAINTALDGLSFTPAGDFNGAAQLQIAVDDQGNTGTGGALADSDTIAITVSAVNDAPVVVMPGPQTTAFQQSLVLSTAGGNAVGFSDVDAGSGTLQLTLVATDGTLTLAQTTGLSFLVGTGTADATIVVQGATADLLAALDGLTFTPTSTFRGNATIDVTVDDLGNSGAGGALQGTGQAAINVAAAAQRLLLNGPTGIGAENFVAVFSSAEGTALTFIDVYAENPALTVTLTAANGTFSLAGTAGLTFLTGGPTGTAMTFTGSVADINAALEGATFTSDTTDAALSIQAQDPPRDGGGAHSVASTITVTQPPVFPGATPVETVDEQIEELLEEIEQLIGFADAVLPTTEAGPTAPPPPRVDLTPNATFQATNVEWKVFEHIAVLLETGSPDTNQLAGYEFVNGKEAATQRGRSPGTADKNASLDAALPWQRIAIVTKQAPHDPLDSPLIAGTAGVAATLSVGYVIWSLRAASLLSTFLASMPAWQAFDPLPVIDFENRRRNVLDDDSDDQNLFAAGAPPSGPTHILVPKS